MAETWVWDGSMWMQRFPLTSPAARTRHAMVYDSVKNEVVLFGGQGCPSKVDACGDTWVWNGSNWLQKFPPTDPPARLHHSMA
ncbi:MAG: hypothetical protein IH846_07285, partial [Acidobacteria bacterium]|nr:hypothetical protein [Acidobacteriota bacterium]